MSSLMNGINNVHSITAQINSLKELGAAPDAESVRFSLEQNFNKMLDSLISATDDEDEDDASSYLEPFAFMSSSNQLYAEYLMEQQAGPEAALQAELVGGDPYLDSLSTLEENPLALQDYLGQVTDLLI